MSWSVMVRAVAELGDVDKLTTEGSKGPIRAPEFMVLRDAVATLTMLAAKVLATPADRLPAVADSDPGGILD